MRRILTLVTFFALLSGCAHKDLKAPCANVAALTAGSVPCDQREAINVTLIPSTFAQ